MQRRGTWELEFFQMLRAFGGDFLDDKNMPAFAGEEGVKAVEKLIEVANACMGTDGYSFALNDQEVAVQQGTLPAANMWASRAANMSKRKRSSRTGSRSTSPICCCKWGWMCSRGCGASCGGRVGSALASAFFAGGAIRPFARKR